MKEFLGLHTGKDTKDAFVYISHIKNPLKHVNIVKPKDFCGLNCGGPWFASYAMPCHLISEGGSHLICRYYAFCYETDRSVVNVNS